MSDVRSAGASEHLGAVVVARLVTAVVPLPASARETGVLTPALLTCEEGREV